LCRVCAMRSGISDRKLSTRPSFGFLSEI